MVWPLVALGDICQFRYGKSLKASDRKPGSVLVMGSNGQVGNHDRGFTVGKTLIIGRKGSIGAVAFSLDSCWPIDTTYFVDETSHTQDPRWLYWQLKQLRLETMNKSAAVPGLNREDAYRLRIPLPPLPEQRRIASILDQADALREATRGAIEHSNPFKSSLLQSRLMHRNDSRDLPFGQIIVAFQNGLYRPGSDYGSGTPVLRIADFAGGEVIQAPILLRVRVEENSSQKFMLSPGELVINRVNAMTHVGKSALVGALDEPTVFESNMMRIQLDAKSVAPRFVLSWLNSESARRQLRGLAKQAINQASVNQQDVASLRLPYLSLAEQLNFVEEIEAVDQLESIQRAHLAKLNELFASLQHRAFRGEL